MWLAGSEIMITGREFDRISGDPIESNVGQYGIWRACRRRDLSREIVVEYTVRGSRPRFFVARSTEGALPLWAPPSPSSDE